MTEPPHAAIDRSDCALTVSFDRKAAASPVGFNGTEHANRRTSGTLRSRISSLPRLNFFRRNDEQDIICAIPEDCPVPMFLQNPAWLFVGRLNWGAVPFPGFSPQVAISACNRLGFYLFQTWGGTPSNLVGKAGNRN